jgi:hypothetical protein
VNAENPQRRMTDDLTAILVRVEALERHNITDDADHIAFRNNDGQTAVAVDKLAMAINDPRTGLIVELAAFRAEVAGDRRVFKAWIAGAVAAVSAVFTIITIYAPALQAALGVHP